MVGLSLILYRYTLVYYPTTKSCVFVQFLPVCGYMAVTEFQFHKEIGMIIYETVMNTDFVPFKIYND